MHHDLKIESPYFEAVNNGSKNFEIRFNDRGFQKGDTVTLHEIDQNGLGSQSTGCKLFKEITYVTGYMQKEGFVVFGIKDEVK